MAREMKDSGIEWIGEIPENWIVIPLKYLLSEPMKYGASESGIDYDESLPRYIRITDITVDGKLKDEGRLSLTDAQSTGYMLSDKTVLFARSGGTVGKTFLYKKEYGKAAFAGYLISAVPNRNKMLSEWLIYFCNSTAYWEWINRIFTQATIQNIGADKYSNMPLSIAPVIEQQEIVRYLDAKCAEIDTVLEKTRASIEEYKKLKQAVITQAVTKGVRGKRNMQDSGIAWIGDIPEEWEIRRIKTLFDLRNERNNLPLSKVNLISLYTDLGVVQHSDLEETTGNKASNADGYKLVYENDIVVNIILCWMGAIGRSAYTGVTSPAYDVYVPKDGVDSRFYHHYFRTTGFSGDCYKRGRGIMAMRWRTYSDQFRDIPVVFPPLNEQEEILKYLDRKCHEIDRLIAKKEQFITELESYKKSLIYEYVTGKKEVPQNESTL